MNKTKKEITYMHPYLVRDYLLSGGYGCARNIAVAHYIYGWCMLYAAHNKKYFSTVKTVALELNIDYASCRSIINRSTMVRHIYSPKKGLSYFEIIKPMKHHEPLKKITEQNPELQTVQTVQTEQTEQTEPISPAPKQVRNNNNKNVVASSMASLFSGEIKLSRVAMSCQLWGIPLTAKYLADTTTPDNAKKLVLEVIKHASTPDAKGLFSASKKYDPETSSMLLADWTETFRDYVAKVGQLDSFVLTDKDRAEVKEFCQR